MFSTIYVEQAILESSRAQAILQRLASLPVVVIEQYGEIFNRNNQNFRLQKQKPALILAQKHGHKVLPTPDGYGFEHMVSHRGGPHSSTNRDVAGFYFSHMLNCVYDCRYCFLQGMYRSANYVVFLNYEDFAEEIARTAASEKGSVFYSGYDCDSLALEPVSGFCEFFLPLFAELPQAVLEIRTKSTQMRFLLERGPLDNCVIAMSFSPQSIAQSLEHKVPSVSKRIDALQKLQQAGWPVALRFEPVIAAGNTMAEYRQLFAEIFDKLDPQQIHSCSLGEFRLPQQYFKRMLKLYPHERLLARETVNSDGMISLANAEPDIMAQLETLLFQYINRENYYRCA